MDMHVFYSLISSIFLLLSILPILLIQINYEYFTIFTFGQKGLIVLLTQICYSLLNWIIALLINKSNIKVKWSIHI
jgi:hypothetical protein